MPAKVWKLITSDTAIALAGALIVVAVILSSRG